jgi:hypothetical protein
MKDFFSQKTCTQIHFYQPSEKSQNTNFQSFTRSTKIHSQWLSKYYSVCYSRYYYYNYQVDYVMFLSAIPKTNIIIILNNNCWFSSNIDFSIMIMWAQTRDIYSTFSLSAYSILFAIQFFECILNYISNRIFQEVMFIMS